MQPTLKGFILNRLPTLCLVGVVACASVLTGGRANAISCQPIFSAASSRDFAILTHRAADRMAVDLIRLVHYKRQNNQNTAMGWVHEIGRVQQQRPLSIVEHSTVLYLLKNHLFAEADVRDLRQSLQLVLTESYRHLSGREPSNSSIEAHILPDRVMKNATTKERLVHDAVVMSKSGGRYASMAKRALTVKNTVYTLLLGAAMSHEVGREIFAGTLLGLAGASLNEYLIHVGIGHASNSLKKKFRKFGNIGHVMEEITLAHRLHHMIVSSYFGAAVLPKEIEVKATRQLRILSEELILDRIQDESPQRGKEEILQSDEYRRRVAKLEQEIKSGNFGVNGTNYGVAAMLASATPFFLLNAAAYHAVGSPELLASSMVSLTFFIVQSLYSHRYMHLRPEDINKTPSTRFMTWYIRSPVGQLQTRLHYVHHSSHMDAKSTKNGAIMAFSIADYILHGGVKQPELSHVLGLEAQGYLDPELSDLDH